MHAKQLIPVDWVARAMAETLVLALHRWRKLAILPAHIHPVPDASAGCSGWWSSHRDSSRLPGAGGVHNIHSGDVRRRFLTSRWYDHSAHPLMGCYRTKKPYNCRVKPFEALASRACSEGTGESLPPWISFPFLSAIRVPNRDTA